MSSSSIDKTVIFAVFVVGWCLCFHAPVKAEMDERASHDASAKEKEEEREKMLLYDKKNPLKVKAKAVIRGMARDLFFFACGFPLRVTVKQFLRHLQVTLVSF